VEIYLHFPYTPSWRGQRKLYLLPLPLPSTPLDAYSMVRIQPAHLKQTVFTTDSPRKAVDPLMMEADSEVMLLGNYGTPV